MNNRQVGITESDITDVLEQLTFSAPPLTTLWAAGSRRPRARVYGPALLAAALILALGGVALAASGFIPSFELSGPAAECVDADACGPDYHVFARAEIEPPGLAVRAFNVIVAEGVGSERIAAIAGGFADRYPDARVIVHFFDGSVDPLTELGGFSGLPTDDATVATVPRTAGWLATLDFARDRHVREYWDMP
jgi:hypothetical protein